MKVDDESNCKHGCPKKVIRQNPGDKTCNRILDSILKDLHGVADEQNVSTGMLLHMLTDRWVEQNSKVSSIESKSNIPVLTACSMLNLNLSLNQYQELPFELLRHRFSLPVRNVNLLPHSVFSEPVKASCDALDLIAQTVRPLLNVNNISPTRNLKVVAKFGQLFSLTSFIYASNSV